MKYVAASIVVVLAVLALAAAGCVYSMRSEQVTVLPPDPTAEQVIPDLVAALAVNNAARAEALMAIGHLASNLQPLPYSSAPTFDNPVQKQQYDERMAAQGQRRARLFALLNAASPQLIQLAGDADATTRRRAIWALGGVHATSPDAKSLLESIALDGGKPSLDRQAAVIALARVDPAEARLAIETILAADRDPGLLSASVSALRIMGAEA